MKGTLFLCVSGCFSRKAFTFLLALVASLGVRGILQWYLNKIDIGSPEPKNIINSAKIYTILVMNPPYNIFGIHRNARHWGFETCEYSNCRITFNKTQNSTSDAVMFDGRSVGPSVEFTRPAGQVWIFAEDEPPPQYFHGHWTRAPWRYSFNWTMNYDISNTDVYLPYGELRKRHTHLHRNYTEIALKKSENILWIASHCSTQSKREVFVSHFEKFMPIKILGKCGEKWKCGYLYNHDDACYQLLNTTYRFYLAFENSLCERYITEKYFDNFNYDVMLVTRAGKKDEFVRDFPKGTYISTDDFDSIEALANYLKEVSHSVNKYAELLKKKDQYYSVGYKPMYQRAICDICKRMNHQDKYRKTIPDMYNHTFDKQPCRKPGDIKLDAS